MLPPSITAAREPHRVMGADDVPETEATKCPAYVRGLSRITVPGRADASACRSWEASVARRPLAGQPLADDEAVCACEACLTLADSAATPVPAQADASRPAVAAPRRMRFTTSPPSAQRARSPLPMAWAPASVSVHVEPPPSGPASRPGAWTRRPDAAAPAPASGLRRRSDARGPRSGRGEPAAPPAGSRA